MAKSASEEEEKKKRGNNMSTITQVVEEDLVFIATDGEMPSTRVMG